MLRFLAFICPILFTAAHFSLERGISKSQHQQFSQLRQFIDTQQWSELGKHVAIGTASNEISLKDLQALATSYPGTPFAFAVQGCTQIFALSEKTGLSLNVLFPLVLFAETALPDEIAQGTSFWPKDRFGRELQYDPQTHHFFIHLGTKGVDPIGKGRKKVVTKTILYNRQQPKVLARAVAECDISTECTAMTRLKNLPCVVHPIALMTHVDPATNKTLTTIVTHLFRPGSLQSVIDDHTLKLTFKERLTIARDLITGLAAMHTKLYVHRNLGARNYFVDIEGTVPGERKIHAVIADMGRALPVIRAYKVPAQSNVCYLSPEGFFRSKMMPFDYFPSDVFAMGCVMWQLYYDKLPAWSKKKTFQKKTIPVQQRHAKHVTLIKRTRARPLKQLQHKQKKKSPLSVQDRFLALILQMTDPNPEGRGKAVDLQTQFDSLLHELN